MNGWLAGLLGAVASAVILGGLGLAAGVFQRGSQALDEDVIRRVLQEENRAIINGETMTYGEALNKISTDVVILQATVKALTED